MPGDTLEAQTPCWTYGGSPWSRFRLGQMGYGGDVSRHTTVGASSTAGVSTTHGRPAGFLSTVLRRGGNSGVRGDRRRGLRDTGHISTDGADYTGVRWGARSGDLVSLGGRWTPSAGNAIPLGGLTTLSLGGRSPWGVSRFPPLGSVTLGGFHGSLRWVAVLRRWTLEWWNGWNSRVWTA